MRLTSLIIFFSVLTFPFFASAGFEGNFQSLEVTDDPFIVSTQKASLPPSPPSAQAGTFVQSWRGRKGESIHLVLKRWAERAHHDLVWDSSRSVTLKSDFTAFGTFEDAVSALLAKNNLQDIQTEIRPEGLTYSTQPDAQPVLLSPEIEPLVTSAFGKMQRWRGLRGANLKEVFEVWAEDAGITLIWGVSDQLALQSSINETARFSDIVNKALEQFQKLPGRPVARLYTAGNPTLVVAPEGAGI